MKDIERIIQSIDALGWDLVPYYATQDNLEKIYMIYQSIKNISTQTSKAKFYLSQVTEDEHESLKKLFSKGNKGIAEALKIEYTRFAKITRNFNKINKLDKKGVHLEQKLNELKTGSSNLKKPSAAIEANDFLSDLKTKLSQGNYNNFSGFKELVSPEQYRMLTFILTQNQIGELFTIKKDTFRRGLEKNNYTKFSFELENDLDIKKKIEKIQEQLNCLKSSSKKITSFLELGKENYLSIRNFFGNNYNLCKKLGLDNSIFSTILNKKYSEYRRDDFVNFPNKQIEKIAEKQTSHDDSSESSYFNYEENSDSEIFLSDEELSANNNYFKNEINSLLGKRNNQSFFKDHKEPINLKGESPIKHTKIQKDIENEEYSQSSLSENESKINSDNICIFISKADQFNI